MKWMQAKAVLCHSNPWQWTEKQHENTTVFSIRRCDRSYTLSSLRTWHPNYMPDTWWLRWADIPVSSVNMIYADRYHIVAEKKSAVTQFSDTAMRKEHNIYTQQEDIVSLHGYISILDCFPSIIQNAAPCNKNCSNGRRLCVESN